MKNEFGIIELLKVFRFDAGLKTKLVRHQDAQHDVPALIRDGWFELYQQLQARPVFDGCSQIVSFVGDGSQRARFVGVYSVLPQKGSSRPPFPTNCPFQAWSSSKYFYALQRQQAYADLEGRIIIDWGTGALAWHQHLRNKRVIEILPKGRSLPLFKDYLDFSLSNSDLKELFANPLAHRDWMSSLSAVAGVYLILAEATGQQYVGSAYGLDGIWGRWIQYAANGHGGNAMLLDMLESDSNYPGAFRYSILQVLPKTATKTEVIHWESQYKCKLGCRAKGLNLN